MIEGIMPNINLRDRCDPKPSVTPEIQRIIDKDFSQDISGMLEMFMSMSSELVKYNQELEVQDLHKQ